MILELPPYRRPSFRSVLLRMWERALIFLRRAGTVILGISIPDFWLGIMLVLLFAATLRLLPPSGFTPLALHEGDQVAPGCTQHTRTPVPSRELRSQAASGVGLRGGNVPAQHHLALLIAQGGQCGGTVSQAIHRPCQVVVQVR